MEDPLYFIWKIFENCFVNCNKPTAEFPTNLLTNRTSNRDVVSFNEDWIFDINMKFRNFGFSSSTISIFFLFRYFHGLKVEYFNVLKKKE